MPKKFSLFGKEPWFVRKNKAGKTVKSRRVAVNQHKTYSQRFKVYLSAKKRILQRLGLSPTEIKSVLEISKMTALGRYVRESPVLSQKAALEVLSFFVKRKNLIVQALTTGRNIQFDPVVLNAVEKRIRAMENAMGKEQNKGFSQGAVERADYILFGKKTNGKKVLSDKLALEALSGLERKYINKFHPNISKEYFEIDAKNSREVFGEWNEIVS